jgi:hypothetical protein
MRGTISFHPVDLRFFDEIIGPLVAGGKIDPQEFIAGCLRHRISSWSARRYVLALELLADESEPPPPPEEGTFWVKLRSRMERFDFKADPMARLAAEIVSHDLHLRGRPFLISDGSPEAVCDVVDSYCEADNAALVEDLARVQLGKIHPDFVEHVRPEAGGEPSPDLEYRSDLTLALKEVHDLARAARRGESWTLTTGDRRPATSVLPTELPWRSIYLHSRTRPFWIADDVDGLENVCRAAGVPPPDFVVPALRLFGDACDEFPKLQDALGCEMERARDVGGFVSPEDVPDLLDWMKENGARIIQAAARHGEGAACSTLLKKIRECAAYARRHGLAYLEASGIEPVEPEIED